MEISPDQHSALEADIKKLIEVVESQKHREAREVIKEHLGGKIFESREVPQPERGVSEKTEAPQSALPDYAQEDMPAEIKLKVEELIDVAWHKGSYTAIAEAWKSAKTMGRSAPAFLDVFHDALTGRMHELMKERGLL